jgi:hypothetical protein
MQEHMKKYQHAYSTRMAALLLAPGLLPFAFLVGCQSQKSTSDSKELFPVFGMVLNKTQADQLREMGEFCGDYGEGLYTIHGQDFWVKNDTFDRMYLVSPDQLPLKWRNMGFDWYLSYDQWLALLNDLGFAVTIEKAPVVEMRMGHASLCAEVKATKQSDVPVELSLNFEYSEKTTTRDEGTLYCIGINAPE